MKKQDLIPIVLIFALFLAYPTIDRKVIAKIFPPKAKPAPAVVETVAAPSIPADTALAAPEAKTGEIPATEAPPPPAAPAEAAAPEEEQAPEVLTTLGNERLELTLSSRGAGIVRAVLRGYPSAKVTFPSLSTFPIVPPPRRSGPNGAAPGARTPAWASSWRTTGRLARSRSRRGCAATAMSSAAASSPPPTRPR